METKNMPVFEVISSKNIGPYENIAKNFQELMGFVCQNSFDLSKEKLFGVYYDDPKEVDSSKLRSSASITYPANFSLESLPSSFVAETMAGGLFQVTSHRVLTTEFMDAWMSAFDTLTNSGKKWRNDSPSYEIYLNDGTSDPEQKWEIEIYLPIHE